MPQRHRDVIVVADADEVARTAAGRLLARLRRSTDRLAVCLAGGSTPERLYELLAREPYRDAVSWKHVHWFWGDDRFVPHEDPRSNYGMARRLLLDRVPVPSDNIWPIPTSAENVEEAARRYETELRRFYGAERLLPGRPLFDIVLMGLGPDGHTASLFPGHAQLEEKVHWVVGVPQAGLEPSVPRVTLTFPALASSREMLFLVNGPSKREILTQVLAGADLPAAHAYSDGELVWLVDRDAAPQRRDRSATFASPGSVGFSPASGKEGEGWTPALPGGGRGGAEPSVIVVMGVSGAGKSTIAAMLADRLGWTYEDADSFHPPSNVEKMRSGQALTDEDRWPWLQGMAAWIEATRNAGGRAVIACSALKRAYRDILVNGWQDVRIVYLKGTPELIARRLALRHEHFMPASLLESQFAALEEPGEDERPIIVSADARPPDIVGRVVARLGIGAHEGREPQASGQRH